MRIFFLFLNVYPNLFCWEDKTFQRERERDRQRETERDRVTKGKEFEEFSFRKEEGKSYRNCLRLKRLARATTLFIIYVAM